MMNGSKLIDFGTNSSIITRQFGDGTDLIGTDAPTAFSPTNLWQVFYKVVLWPYGCIGLSAIVFRLLDWCILLPLVRHYYTHNTSSHKQWRIRNEGTSLVHALVSGCWALGTFVWFPEMWADMVYWYNPYTYSLVLLSVGYLVQDAIDLTLHERSLRVLELMFHHVSIVFAFMCCVLTRRFVPLVACGLLMEVNSIFLHSRSLCNLHRIDKQTTLYRLISVTNVATCIVFRLSTTVFMLVWDCLHFQHMQPFYFGVLFFVMFSLLCVNVILFYRILLADSYLQPSAYNGCLIIPWPQPSMPWFVTLSLRPHQHQQHTPGTVPVERQRSASATTGHPDSPTMVVVDNKLMQVEDVDDVAYEGVYLTTTTATNDDMMIGGTDTDVIP